eukprot:COSAG02_NODE_6378_length_3611_cov_203.740319_3_plen_47_part_00
MRERMEVEAIRWKDRVGVTARGGGPSSLSPCIWASDGAGGALVVAP